MTLGKDDAECGEGAASRVLPLSTHPSKAVTFLVTQGTQAAHASEGEARDSDKQQAGKKHHCAKQ